MRELIKRAECIIKIQDSDHIPHGFLRPPRRRPSSLKIASLEFRL